MPIKSAFTVSDAIRLVEDLAKKYDPHDLGQINYSDFKRHIITNHGSDKKTIAKYREVLELFGLARVDEYGAGIMFLTYKNSEDYKKYKSNQKTLGGF